MSVISSPNFQQPKSSNLSLEDFVNAYVGKIRSDLPKMLNRQLIQERLKFFTGTKVEEPMVEELDIPSSGNVIMDMYYLEGMKLFHQGPFAKNLPKEKTDEL